MATHALSSGSPDQQRSDGPSRPELPRSISTTNLETTRRCRSLIQKDWKADAPRGGTNFFATTPGFTLILPALNDYPSDFQKFVFDRIVAKDTQEMMEKDCCLNWCPSVTKLVPLNTIGDGNCLLHAASLAMWGFQDRDLVLRNAVSRAVNVNIENNTLYQRWKHNRMIENQEYGIELEPHQWDQEWEVVKQQTSTSALSGRNWDSLDEFHIFVLANVLRRPILMYAAPKVRSHQTNGTLQKINFHGVYLPLLWAPDSCKKDPLPLAYHLGHFSALVVVESFKQYRHGLLLLALSDYYSRQLPVRFILPVEDPNTLIMDYLHLVQVPSSGSPYFSHGHIVCAKLTISDVPLYLKPLISGFVDACYESYIAQMQSSPSPKDETNAEQSRPHCINNCGMYGDPATGLCSKCHQKAISAAQAQEKAASEDKAPQQAQGQFQQHGHEHETTDAVSGHQSTVSMSGAIKCPRCSNLGHPSYLGMCEHCFVSTSANRGILSDTNTIQQEPSVSESIKAREPVYEVLPNYHNFPPEAQSPPQLTFPQPPAVPPPRNVGDKIVERSQCRAPGCEFFGTKETRFYCSKCFDANVEMILKEVDSSNVNLPPLHSQPQHPSSGGELAHATITSQFQPIQAPPKCYRCKDFFANDEYNGMCHGCFMKKTRTESQDAAACVEPEKRPTELAMKPTEQGKLLRNVMTCNTEYCTNPATENGFCEYCNVVAVGCSKSLQVSPSPANSNSPQPSRSPTVSIPMLGRTNFTSRAQSTSSAGKQHVNTAPVVNLATSMAGVSLAAFEPSRCFLCDGGNGIGSSNFVCEHHARMMRQVVHSKPVQSTSDQRRVLPSPYEEPRLSRSQEERLAISSSSAHANSNKSDIAFGIPLPPSRLEHNAVPLTSTAGKDCSGSHSDVVRRVIEYRPGLVPSTDSPMLQHDVNGSGAQDTAKIAVCGNKTCGGYPPAKTLCATPGCSFKGYEELQKLCPDCYQEKYNRVPSQEYPLV